MRGAALLPGPAAGVRSVHHAHPPGGCPVTRPPDPEVARLVVRLALVLLVTVTLCLAGWAW